MSSDPSTSTELMQAACLTPRHSIFGQAQKGINSLKSKFGKGKKGDNEITEVGSSTGTLGKDASSDENDSDTLADKQDEVVTVKATPA